MSVEKLYRFPLPDNLGVHIDRDDGRKVERVTAGSPAAQAGLAVGDEITHLSGQPIVSIADVQWVLHNLPNDDVKLEATLSRGGRHEVATLNLAKGWKKTDFMWRGSRWSLKPQPGFWAPALNEKQLKDLGAAVPAGAKPLRIQWINANRAEGKAAKQAGLKEGDVIIGLNGQPFAFPTPEAFQMHVRLNCKVGDIIKLKVLRNGKELDVSLPLIE